MIRAISRAVAFKPCLPVAVSMKAYRVSGIAPFGSMRQKFSLEFAAENKEDAEHQAFVYGEKSLGVTADQDLSIGAMQQQGLGSAGFRDFYLSQTEIRLQNFHERLNDYLDGTV